MTREDRRTRRTRISRNAGSSVAVGARIGLIATLGHTPGYMLAVLAPVLAIEIDLSVFRLGVCTAAFFLLGGAFAPIGGYFSDRFSAARVLVCALLSQVLFLLLVYFYASEWIGLAVLIGASGVGNGFVQPAAGRIIFNVVPTSRQGIAFGIKQASVPASVLLGAILSPLIDSVGRWNAPFLFGALVVLACTPLALVRHDSLRRTQANGVTLTVVTKRPRRALIVFGAVWALGAAASNNLTVYLPSFLVGQGLSFSSATLYVFIGASASILTRVFNGVSLDKMGFNPFSGTLLMMLGGAIATLILVFGAGPVLLVATIIGFGLGWGWAGLMTFGVMHYYRNSPGFAIGVCEGAASVGASLGPLSFGVMADQFGFSAGWWLAAAIFCSAAVLLVYARSVWLRIFAP